MKLGASSVIGDTSVRLISQLSGHFCSAGSNEKCRPCLMTTSWRRLTVVVGEIEHESMDNLVCPFAKGVDGGISG